MITTALFDIKRNTKGDGRTIKEYLNWFESTLKIKCDVTVYTEKKFEEFVSKCRQNSPYKTNIVIQDLTQIPFYKNREVMANIMRTSKYVYRMKDPRRIECYLPEYNLIQYSKFGWLEQTATTNPDHDFFFWMDAGCSRFFLDTDLGKEWPDTTNLDINKFIIQRNTHFPELWETLDINEYIWDNRCILVGTLFGGGKEIIFKMKNLIDEICDKVFFANNCINNEQLAIAIAAKTNTDIFDIKKQCLAGESEGSSHLPLFKSLSKDYVRKQNEK